MQFTYVPWGSLPRCAAVFSICVLQMCTRAIHFRTQAVLSDQGLHVSLYLTRSRDFDSQHDSDCGIDNTAGLLLQKTAPLSAFVLNATCL